MLIDKELKDSTKYIIVVALFVIINFLILQKWIMSDYSGNSFAGAIVYMFLFYVNIAITTAYFIGFIIAGIIKKKQRILYLFTAFLCLIPFGVIYVVG